MRFVNEDRDEDLRREAILERRRARKRGCECGDDLPGHCPGRDQCPYASHEEEENEDE